MRVAHITDLHVEVVPRAGQLLSKRAIGAVNLYVFGRHAHFTEASVRACVDAVLAAAPDIVVCTGDLTATATPEEFVRARELLAPLLERFPFVTLPGNHDVYTRGSLGRFREHFGAWAHDAAFPFVIRNGGVDFVCVDVSRPDWLSRGQAGADVLARLDALLAAGTDPAVVLVHYPLRDRHGEPYGPATRSIVDAAALEAVIARAGRVAAVLHGHEHHGYRTEIPRAGGGRPIPSFDPGASGYAWLPDRRRTAHFNVYDIDADGGIAVERLAFDGSRFVAEVGGAYATGG
ncbi:MAG: metallophosphoesterase family protein [Myxococcota bacterium]